MSALVPQPQTLGALALLLVKAAILLGVADIATRMMPSASAAARHFVWVVALVAALALPAVAAVVPSFDVPLLTGTTMSAPTPAASGPEVAASTSGSSERGATPRPSGAAPANGASSEDGASGARADGRALMSIWVPLAWAAGALLLSARIVVGVAAARRMARSSRPAPQAMQSTAADLCDRLGIAPVRAVISDQADVPMVWGLWRPVMVLPPETPRWSPERLQLVMLHELAHVQRGDCLSQMVAHVAVALHWVNPLAWRAAARLRSERELACDEVVLRSGMRGSEYAKHLLDIARAARGGGAAGAVALPMARPSQLEGRLLAILNAGDARRSVGRSLRWSVSLAALVMVFPLAALQPWGVADAGEPEESIAQTATTAAIEQPAEALRRTGRRLVEEGATESVEEFLAGVAESTAPAEQAEGPSAARRAARERARGALEEALDDADASVRSDAAHALGMIESAASVAALVAALGDESNRVRSQVAWALGMIESADAVAGIASAATTESDGAVRAQMAWALGMIESSEGLAALRLLADDDSPRVRSQVAWAVGMIESSAGVELAARLLSDASESVRRQAAWALGMIESSDGVTPLVEALPTASDTVRGQIVWALGMIESEAAVPALLELLDDPSASLRKEVCWALGMIESDVALDALIDAMEDEDRSVQRAALAAITRITG